MQGACVTSSYLLFDCCVRCYKTSGTSTNTALVDTSLTIKIEQLDHVNLLTVVVKMTELLAV